MLKKPVANTSRFLKVSEKIRRKFEPGELKKTTPNRCPATLRLTWFPFRPGGTTTGQSLVKRWGVSVVLLGDPNRWMVYFRETPNLKCMITRGTCGSLVRNCHLLFFQHDMADMADMASCSK